MGKQLYVIIDTNIIMSARKQIYKKVSDGKHNIPLFRCTPVTIDIIKGGVVKRSIKVESDRDKVYTDVLQMVNKYNRRNTSNLIIYCYWMVCFHMDFVEIHPFTQGNGRTARGLISFNLKNNGYCSDVYMTGERLFIKFNWLYRKSIRMYFDYKLLRFTAKILATIGLFFSLED